MITTLLLQTMMASDGDQKPLASAAAASSSTTMVKTAPSTGLLMPGTARQGSKARQLQQQQQADGETPVGISAQIQQVIDAAEAAKASGDQAIEAAKAVLKSQSWGDMLWGSVPRAVWTGFNATALLAAGGMTAYLQFAPHNAAPSTSAPAGAGTTTTAAPVSYYNQAVGFYDSLSPSDQRVMQGATGLWVVGILDSAVQYCVTKGNNLKEALQSDIFDVGDAMAGGSGNEPTATDWFKDVKSVTVGEGEDEMTMTLAAFQKREGFDAKNPFAKDAFSVTLNDGTVVQINNVGQRVDQVPSAASE